MRAVVQTKNNMNIKKDYALNLTTNYQDKPVDHLGKLVTDNTHSIDLAPQKEEGRKIEKSVLAKKEIRSVMDDLFVDTTDVTIGEVTVIGEKTKSQKEQITQKYGSPDYSVGKKRIEELVKEKPWNYGLMTILSNAFPNLYIETSQVTMTYKRYSGVGPPPQTSNIIVSNSPNITFQLIGKRMHRFFIFVDGELISTSDTHGMVKSAAKGYSLNDLISLDPDLVTSIDLIFPNKNNSHSSLNGAAEIYEHEMRQSSSSAETSSGEASSSGNNSGNPLLQTNENADVMAKDLADLADESDKLVTPVAVLSIYTKDGAGMLSATHYKGIANLTLHGFTRVKEFYHPNYSKESNDTILSDLRNTLTWLPNLHTDSTGKASVSFYTSDVSNTFRVEVNGLSTEGKAGALLYKMSNPMFERKADSIIAKENQAVANKQLAKATRILLPDSTGAAYALVSCPAKGWSTFTSPEGYFFMNETGRNDTTTIEVSKPGYRTAEFLIEGNSSKTITLVPSTNSQSALSAEEILKSFYRNKSKNRNPNDFYLKGAYREQLFNGDDLQQLTDFYFIQQWPSLAEANGRIETHLNSGRVFQSTDVSDKIPFTPQNRYNDAVPMMDPLFAKLSFLNPSFTKNYQFECVGETTFEGRKMYHIKFDQATNTPWALYKGELYIDAETFGLAWVQWQISDKGEKYLMPDEYLAAGGNPETFKRNNEHNEITFSFNGEFWIPQFAITNVSFSQKGQHYKILREIAWNPASPDEKFKSLFPDDMNRRLTIRKTPEYKPGNWRPSWLLPPSTKMMNQVKFLNEVTSYRQ